MLTYQRGKTREKKTDKNFFCRCQGRWWNHGQITFIFKSKLSYSYSWCAGWKIWKLNIRNFVHSQLNSISTIFKWFNYKSYAIDTFFHRITFLRRVSLHSFGPVFELSIVIRILCYRFVNYVGLNGTLMLVYAHWDPITFTGLPNFTRFLNWKVLEI